MLVQFCAKRQQAQITMLKAQYCGVKNWQPWPVFGTQPTPLPIGWTLLPTYPR